MRLVSCDIEFCKKLGPQDDGAELGCLFKKIPPESPDDVDKESLCYLLSNYSGGDISFLTEQSKGVGSVMIQSKVKMYGSFMEAAMTTDPNLQFMTNEQRRDVINGKPIRPSSRIDHMRKAYKQFRERLGDYDPFKKCHRFVAGLRFQSKTMEVAIDKYFSTSCPLLPLEFSKGLPPSEAKKMELHGGYAPEPMRRMRESCVLREGIKDLL